MTMSTTTTTANIMEQLLHEAIVEGVTELTSGTYTLTLRNRTATLYADGEAVCQRPIDQETVGEQCPEFYNAAGLC